MVEPASHVGDVVVRYRATEHRLRPGDRLTFGRACPPDQPGEAHLALSDSFALHARAGALAVDDSGCTLSNTGRWLRLRLVHLDGVERSDLDPGRHLRVPWARSRVEVAARSSAG